MMRQSRAIIAGVVALLGAAVPALALEPAASEIFSLVNGTLSSSCTANTVVTGGSPLACSATLPSQVAVSGSAITLSTSVSTTASRLARDATLNRLRFGDGTNAQIVDTSAVNAQAYLACDGTTDDRAALASLIQTGGACAGKDCVIPAGCLVLLSSPGAGSAAVSIPTGTRVICEDRTTSTFRLARHYCSGGNQSGSFGDSSVTCRSGSLTCDVGSGDNCEFAPTSGSTYTVFKSDTLASKPAVIGCKFDLRQIEAYGRCAGGSQSGKACSTADTNATTGCPSSTCTVDPEEPSGDGKIVAIDFALATDATIDDVEIYNAKYSDYLIRIATSGVARRLQIDSYDTNTPAVVPTFSLAALLVLNGAAVFDSVFGRGTVGVDAGSSASIIAHNRFVNTTSGITGAGALNVANNKIDTLANGGGFGISAGASSIITGNTITNAQDGIKISSTSEVSGNNISTTTRGVSPVSSTVSDSQITGNYIIGQKRVGIAITSRNQVVGNYLSGGSVSDTSTSPVTPSTAVTVAGIQNLVTNNYITAYWFFGVHPVEPSSSSYNIGIWNNRFAFGPVGPAIVTGGAGWHIGTNYFNQVQNGWCSDPTASNYLGQCTCTTKQCSAGTNTGANCITLGANTSECGTGGTCTAVDTTVDNPYGKYGGVTGTCFAYNGYNSGGTCDSTPTLSKSDCSYAPIVQVGADAQLPGATAYSSASHPSFVVGKGWGSSGSHVKIENNILARGIGSTDIRFGDAKVCGGSYVPTCQGTGGNAGTACTADSDCTSTGCIWGTGNCCGQVFKLCSAASDCQSLSKQCNSLGGTLGATCTTDANCGGVTGACQTNSTTCAGISHGDTSITSNYLYPGFQAIDAFQTNGTIDGLTLTSNIVDASPRGIKFPSTASKVTRGVVQGNQYHLAVAKTGSELENWVATMGLASGNVGLSGGEYQTNELYLVNKNAASMSAGYAVQVDTGTANGVELATANSPETVLGILAADSSADGDPARVVMSGITDCYVSATVALGDRLTLDASVNGNLVKTTLGTQGTIARAIASRTGAGLVRCVVGQGSGTYSSATQVNFAFAKKTADESVCSTGCANTTGTTFQADDHMSLSLTSGTAYAIEGYILMTSSGAGGGAKIAIDYTSTATDWLMTVCGGNTTGCGTTTTFSSSSAIHNLSTVNGGIGFWIKGSVKPSGNGSIKIYFAQNTSSGTATTAKTGSYIRAIAIP